MFDNLRIFSKRWVRKLVVQCRNDIGIGSSVSICLWFAFEYRASNKKALPLSLGHGPFGGTPSGDLKGINHFRGTPFSGMPFLGGTLICTLMFTNVNRFFSKRKVWIILVLHKETPGWDMVPNVSWSWMSLKVSCSYVCSRSFCR